MAFNTETYVGWTPRIRSLPHSDARKASDTTQRRASASSGEHDTSGQVSFAPGRTGTSIGISLPTHPCPAGRGPFGGEGRGHRLH